MMRERSHQPAASRLSEKSRQSAALIIVHCYVFSYIAVVIGPQDGEGANAAHVITYTTRGIGAAWDLRTALRNCWPWPPVQRGSGPLGAARVVPRRETGPWMALPLCGCCAGRAGRRCSCCDRQ
mmetsp:Transcript_115463/g.337717  ORF Transcript_115463/g.337717 Transcript_115463/m.337717 type:complete len:124 (-) Transcript_115463:226-597(-)